MPSVKLTCSVDRRDNCGDELTAISLVLIILCDERAGLEAEEEALNPGLRFNIGAALALLIGYFDITCPIRTPEV